LNELPLELPLEPDSKVNVLVDSGKLQPVKAIHVAPLGVEIQ